jgi:mono/diheme cytochrome c family protein
MKNFLGGIGFTLIVFIVAVFWYTHAGYMDFDADQQPSFLERHFAMAAVDASTDRHAPEVKNPISPTEENLVAGAQLYVNHCAGCHGVPSDRDSQFGRSFYPTVPGFFKDSPDMAENQNFYIIEHGIRWSGMPAWNQTLSDGQVWQLVTFMSNIEKLPPAALKVFEPTAQTAGSGVPVGSR